MTTKETQKPLVFIGCSAEALPIASEFQVSLSHICEVKVWNQSIFKIGEYGLTSLLSIMKKIDFAIFIWNDDDTILSRGEEIQAPRDNVILEIGMAIQSIGQERVFIVHDRTKKTKIPSDLQGINRASYVPHSDGDLCAALGAACHEISKRILELKSACSTEDCLREQIENLSKNFNLKNGAIKGKRLFQHTGVYPIKLNKGNIPSIDVDVYRKAMVHFLKDENYDRLSAMDLIYLRENNLNFEPDFLKEQDFLNYQAIISKYEIDAESFRDENDFLLNNYIRIIDDLGDTFKGLYVEFILHNVRNPLHSIVAVKNTDKISNRKLYDPSTRFVFHYVVNQGRFILDLKEGDKTKDKVAYLKELNKGKFVKATTTPIYDARYGLIGIICINIDIDTIRHLDSYEKTDFFENYTKNSGYTPAFEK